MKFNARLRGWQRITTQLKHNNRNHRGSMGLETPRVDSPFEAFVRYLLLLNVNEPICIKTTLFRHFYELVQNASFYSRRS
ncbi:Uncharacterised protein [Vibrio cholerae]|nr:Uncharacterised protein [Vibrio cholerae]